MKQKRQDKNDKTSNGAQKVNFEGQEEGSKDK